MLPALHRLRSLKPLLTTLVTAAIRYVPSLRTSSTGDDAQMHTYVKRDMSHGEYIAFACLIPVLVILSGVFAGLTLGYMSLDETQLNVLSISGTPKQKLYANKIKPIRKDGHLLLVTLLLANMIVNETLPVISDPILGGGVQSVVVSTVLIVIFSEIIPQSLCTRYGLYFGAKMAGVVRVLIWTLGIVAYPVAKLLELVLGPHHGIIYRRAELKELIAMHSNMGELGGDLRTDTVTIIGGALDLQEKVVKQAMTPIENVFMLSIDSRLDESTLRKICRTGHSRVPVYEEVEIPAPKLAAVSAVGLELPEALAIESTGAGSSKTIKVKKIVGILLVKQCVLLDPKDATPLRDIPLNKVPLVPHNEPLLGILDKFQEGRSHIAIVSRFSVARAASVKQAVKRGLTQRLRQVVHGSDSESESESDEEEGHHARKWPHLRRKRSDRGEESSENEQTLRESSHGEGSDDAASRESARPKKMRAFSTRGRRKQKAVDLEMGVVEDKKEESKPKEEPSGSKSRRPSLTLGRAGFWGREQDMPADAVLSREGAEEFLQSVDPALMPLGIITLEDVLEELIGEEIYDEFDPQGHPDLSSYVPATKPKPSGGAALHHRRSAPQLAPHDTPTVVPSSTSTTMITKTDGTVTPTSSSARTYIMRPTAIPAIPWLPLRVPNPLSFKGPGSISRSHSAPPTPREQAARKGGEKDGDRTPTVPEGEVLVIPPASTSSEDVGPLNDNCDAEKDVGTSSNAGTYIPETMESSTTVSPIPTYVHVDAPAPRNRASPGQTLPTFLSVQGMNLAAMPPSVNASLSAGSKPTSRSSSPSPSLEQAILIERKRRAAAVGSVTAPKGARFKSSPLTGAGERAGVITAERVQHEASVNGESPEAEKADQNTNTDASKE